MKILVTGAAGFIGARLTERLLERGDEVVGIDNLNDYYEVSLKLARLARFESHPAFAFLKLDIEDRPAMADLFARERPTRVVHLAAQAGVRYSLENPHAYIDANIVGTMNVLEGCRHNGIEHLVYASSSSVYGANTRMPFSVHDNVDHPLSLYAATKKANELMAHTYSHLYGLPATGLRFFTVYGPWGRPDMSLFMFTRKILNGEPIDVFNFGKHRRDFTYVDDIVSGVIGCVDTIATANPAWRGDAPDPGTAQAPHRLGRLGDVVDDLRRRLVRLGIGGRLLRLGLLDERIGIGNAGQAGIGKLVELFLLLRRLRCGRIRLGCRNGRNVGKRQSRPHGRSRQADG